MICAVRPAEAVAVGAGAIYVGEVVTADNSRAVLGVEVVVNGVKLGDRSMLGVDVVDQGVDGVSLHGQVTSGVELYVVAILNELACAVGILELEPRSSRAELILRVSCRDEKQEGCNFHHAAGNKER
jgi:hypothetical protein